MSFKKRGKAPITLLPEEIPVVKAPAQTTDLPKKGAEESVPSNARQMTSK